MATKLYRCIKTDKGAKKYTLVNESNEKIVLSENDIKKLIKSREIEVINLKLLSSGNLIEIKYDTDVVLNICKELHNSGIDRNLLRAKDGLAGINLSVANGRVCVTWEAATKGITSNLILGNSKVLTLEEGEIQLIPDINKVQLHIMTVSCGSSRNIPICAFKNCEEVRKYLSNTITKQFNSIFKDNKTPDDFTRKLIVKLKIQKVDDRILNIDKRR